MLIQFTKGLTAHRLLVAYLFLGFTTTYNLYWGVFNPPTGNYFTTDEQFIADSGVLMLYGLTPRCLDWPAIPMVLLYYVLTLLHSGFDLLMHVSGLKSLPDLFTRIDQLVAQYFMDRSPYLMAGRLIQITLTTGLLAGLVKVFHRADYRRLPPLTGLFLSLLVVINADVLSATTVIRPEALAYPLCMVLTGLLLFGKLATPRSQFICLLLTALLISQRLIFIVMLPFWIGGLLLRINRFSVRSLVGVSGGLLGLLFLTMPFLWTDTLVLIKAFAGGVLVKVGALGQPLGFNWSYLLNSAQIPANWVYGLTPIGAYFFIRQYPQRSVAWLFVITIFLYGIMVFRSSVIYSTHTMPLRCLSWPLIAYAGVGICEGLWGNTQVARIGVGILGIALAFLVVWEGIDFEKCSHQPLTKYEVVAWFDTLPASATVLMPNDFEGVMVKSRRCLERERTAIEDSALASLKMQRLMSYVGGRNDKVALPVLWQVTMSEDEKAALIQHDLLIQYSPKRQPADTYFFSTSVGFINYYLPQEQALNDFEAGRYTYAIVDQPLAHQTPLKVFNQGWGVTYYAYARPEAPKKQG